MTLGTNDKKKVGFLAVLGLIGAYVFYDNVLAGPDVPAASTPAPRAAASAPAPTVAQPAGPPPAQRSGTTRNRGEEFRPALRSKRPTQGPVVTDNIDPTLRTDLLAKVQAVDLAGGSRNVFQFGTAPAAKTEPLKGREPVVAHAFVGPREPPPPAPPPPPKPDPPPPPIPLKFYGFSTAGNNGKKTAYFLAANEEIILASEGETVQRRYRVIRINATSVVMEDTEVKKQQTLTLVEEAQGE